jgi:hypothetical protein
MGLAGVQNAQNFLVASSQNGGKPIPGWTANGPPPPANPLSLSPPTNNQPTKSKETDETQANGSLSPNTTAAAAGAPTLLGAKQTLGGVT